MSAIATVISGAPKSRISSIVHFVKEIGFKEHVLLRYPGIEEVFGRDDLELVRQKRCLAKDIIETKAAGPKRRGSRACVLVGCVTCTPGTPEFHECERIMVQERDAIHEFLHFNEYFVACLTPYTGIYPIVC